MLVLNKNKVCNYTLELEKFILNNQKSISDWLKEKSLPNVPLYSSVDIRNSGFKVSPIDTNLFPSGFNNISKTSLRKATQYFLAYIEKHFPNSKNIGLVPELFTRNLYYYQHLKILFESLSNTKLNIRLLSVGDVDYSINKLKLFSFKKVNNVVITNDNWSPDLIILNNDLTKTIPVKLANLTIPILPDLKYGWHSRRKSNHYCAYNLLIHKFCADFKLDAWTLSTYYIKCSNINFKNKQGLEGIAHNIDKLIIKIQDKYTKYNIKYQPFVFIKANNGTFGRGIITVSSGQEIININKRLRDKLNTIKDNVINSEVIVQEGIPTIQKIKTYPAESIIYLVGSKVIGKFIRYNTMSNTTNNLNSKGMLFRKDPKISLVELLLSKLASISVAYEKIK